MPPCRRTVWRLTRTLDTIQTRAGPVDAGSAALTPGGAVLWILKNAKAGRGRRQPSAAAIRARLGDDATLIETGAIDELTGAARAIQRDPGAQVASWGGDGTLTAVLSALRGVYGEAPLPPLCVLSGGTMNLVAREVGSHGPPLQVLERLLAHTRSARPSPLVQRTPIACEEHVGFLFGIGLLAHFLEALYEGGRAGTLRSLSVLGGASLASLWGGGLIQRLFRPFTARVTVDGRPWEKSSWVNISAGGITSLGLGFRPYLRACERPGAFHLIAHDLRPLETVLQLPGIWLNRGMKRTHDAVSADVLIETEHPMPFSFEGELFPPRARFPLRALPPLSFFTLAPSE